MIIMIVLVVALVVFLTLFIRQGVLKKYFDEQNKWRYDWREEDKHTDKEKEKIIKKASKYNEDSQFTIGMVLIFVSIAVFVSSLVIGIVNSKWTRERIKAEYEVRVAETQASYEAIQNVQDVIAKVNAITEYNEKISRYRMEIKQAKINLKSLLINWFESKVYQDLDENVFVFIGEQNEC